MSNKKNGTIYIGVTSDLVKRVWEHKNKITKGFTTRYDLTRLVYYEIYEDVTTAIERENAMKQWNRGWKTKRIYEVNPEWDDLYNTIAV